MAATPLTKSTRYIHPAVATVIWADTIDDIHAPTRSEIDAGTDLTGEIADAPGWGVSANRVPTPDLGTKFTSRITGRIDPEDGQIVFYASVGGEDIRALLGLGDRGNLIICYSGDVEDYPASVFPVEVAALSEPLSVAGDPAQMTIDFAATEEPAVNVPLPAASGG